MVVSLLNEKAVPLCTERQIHSICLSVHSGTAFFIQNTSTKLNVVYKLKGLGVPKG
jgi:hypothetical protein